MEDVLDVYKRPYDAECPVVGLDEKPAQLLAEVRAPAPCAPGRPARQDYEYRRNGTANIFCAFERSGNRRLPRDPLAGWRRLEVTKRRTRLDFAAFVKGLLDGHYRDARKVVLVMDQLNTHSPASLYEAFEPAEAKRLADRLEIHHTPKHGSWLNVAEVELSALGKRLPGRVSDASALAAHVAAVERDRNDGARGCDWQFTADDARVKLKRLYPSIEVR
jgi:DDE superfamily endonuclease